MFTLFEIVYVAVLHKKLKDIWTNIYFIVIFFVKSKNIFF
jgi:hypothetical protein